MTCGRLPDVHVFRSRKYGYWIVSDCVRHVRKYYTADAAARIGLREANLRGVDLVIHAPRGPVPVEGTFGEIQPISQAAISV